MEDVRQIVTMGSTVAYSVLPRRAGRRADEPTGSMCVVRTI